MDDEQATRLFELADSIVAVSRLISASKEHAEVYGSTESPRETWSPLDAAVLRFIDHHPGTSAGEAAEATQMISSNFSRALRGLEKKGLVRREADERDARRVRLYPTELATENLRQLQLVWSRMLDGILDDAETVDTVNATLRHLETELGRRVRTSPRRRE